MRILMVGDVVGRPGRHAFTEYTAKLRRENQIDLVVVNGENAAHGKGLTQPTFSELLSGGADIVTSGNHIWDNKDVYGILDSEPYLIRPANYPEGTPGKGFCVYPYRAKNIGVINLQGRTFMPPLDCPFTRASEILRQLKNECDVILVDFHAEATAEKMSLGFFLDGKVTAVVGTHTHVQTADERILPNGTAYVTDLGMVGALNSVIGVNPEAAVEKFLTCRLNKLEVAEEGAKIYCGVVIEIDNRKNRAVHIERVKISTN